MLFETRWISCVYNSNIGCYLKLNLEYICVVYLQAKSAIVVEVFKFVFFRPLFWPSIGILNFTWFGIFKCLGMRYYELYIWSPNLLWLFRIATICILWICSSAQCIYTEHLNAMCEFVVLAKGYKAIPAMTSSCIINDIIVC